MFGARGTWQNAVTRTRTELTRTVVARCTVGVGTRTYRVFIVVTNKVKPRGTLPRCPGAPRLNRTKPIYYVGNHIQIASALPISCRMYGSVRVQYSSV